MKQKKEVRITLRLTQEQYDSIAAKAETAQMPHRKGQQEHPLVAGLHDR